MQLKTTARLLPLAALASLSAPVCAQWGQWGNSSPLLPFLPENRIPWPTSGADFARTLLLQVDGDGIPDGVVIANGQAFLLRQPAYYDWVTGITFPTAPAPSGVKDVAVLSVGGDEDPDMLLLTDSRGLYRTSWGGSGFTDPVVEATGRWINAGPFHVVDLNGDGRLDVVGRAGDGLAAVTRQGNAGGGFSVGLTLIPPDSTAVIDAVGVQWDGTGPREVAVLASNGVHIYNASGTRIEHLTHDKPSGAITTFMGSALGDELLAWTRPNSLGTGNELLVVAPGVSESQTLFFDDVANLGPFWNGSLEAGQYDGIAGDELVLAHTSKPYAAVLRNLGVAGAHFDVQNDAHHDLVSLGLPGSVTGAGLPAFGDLDRDGQEDLLIPVEGSNEVLAFRTLPEYRTGVVVAPNSADVFLPNTEYSEVGSTPHGELRLALEKVYAQYTHVSVKLWYASGASTLLSPEGHGHWEWPLSTASDHQWKELPSLFPLSSNNDWLCWSAPNHHFYLEVRFFKTVNGVRTYSAKFFGGWTLQSACGTNDGDFDGWLCSIGLQNSQFYLYTENGLPNVELPPPSQTFVGSFVPMSSLPSFSSTPPVPSQVIPFESPLMPF